MHSLEFSSFTDLMAMLAARQGHGAAHGGASASVSYEDTLASLPMASTGVEVAGLSPDVSTGGANGRHVWR